MSYLTPNEVKQSVCDIIAYFKLRGQANFIRDALELFFETYHYRLPLFPDNQYFEQP
ncbi:hypothetical protein [Desulforamulus putei]|uniref:hypothetical protein n=1 Tax=Desulforamulus putei TaxID=74701 RepID=UPI002FDD4C46